MEVNKKGTLIGIIILLCIFIPSTILGITGKVLYGDKETINTEDENTNHEFLYNDKLHFYMDDVLINTYDCTEGYTYCGLAYETIDDVNYNLDYYDDGSIDQIPVILGKYAFIAETTTNSEYARDSKVKLYDIVNGRVLIEYNAVKNYTVGINGGIFIANSNGKWGTLQITDTGFQLGLPFEYDYIGLKNNVENGTLNPEKYITKTGDNWNVINQDLSKNKGNYSSPIVNYNEEFVVVVNSNSTMNLFDLDGKPLLNSQSYNAIKLVNKYAVIFDNTNMLYLYDLKMNVQVGNQFPYSNISEITITEDETNITINKGNTELQKTPIN